MKFVLVFYGSRGDVEPCIAVARELVQRGHEVRMAVSPNLIDFTESAGLRAMAFGPDARAWQDLHRDFMTHLFGRFWRFRELVRLGRANWQLYGQFWQEANTTLKELAGGADLLVADAGFDQPVANVAERYGIPLVTLHTSPLRVHSDLVPKSSPLIRAAMVFSKWLGWRLEKKFQDAQRRELGLPKAVGPASRRITESGALEIQAYDEACFPGLASEWAEFDSQRPLVGALTIESPTEADDEISEWMAAGTPPIFFGFGSMPVASAGETLAMIGGACEKLGERALVCAAGTDFSEVPPMAHVKVVGEANFACVFPSCRAVVHHGGTGTTAAGLRAGVPSVILWTWLDQALWGAQVKRLKVGVARRLSTTTQESLVEDLRTVLATDYVARAREFAPRMTKPAEAAAAAANRLEQFALLQRVG